jgi:O-antigen ligase
LLGFVIPLLWNFVTILQGKGLGMEIYWTGLKRYSGVYSNIHTMGHNMGLLVMVVSIYYVLTTDVLGKALKTSYKILLLLMVLIALYCLYKSQTRTVYVGLAVFMVVWLFYYNKKMLVGLILFSVIGLIGVSSKVETIFFDVKEALEGQRDIERAGSGRPFIWMHNLEIFMDVGVEKKLAGVGIGNTKSAAGADRGTVDEGVGVVWNSHNDYLGVLMETGVVGFVIQLVIYLLIFQKIRKLSPKEKSVFLGLFCAIVAMNLLSNSYISRFGLAQMFFMILVYIELPRLKTTTEKTKEAVVKNDDKRCGFQSVRLR